MTDTSTESGTEESSGLEINADVDGLSIDGTTPEVGDSVEVKVGGTVSKVVNGVATIGVETVNGTPVPASPNVAEPDSDDLGQMAEMADSRAAY